jgi:sensor histidine kinase YesM
VISTDRLETAAPLQARSDNRFMPSLWNKDRPPTLREYPFVLLRSLVAGALFGIVASSLVQLGLDRQVFRQWPTLFFYSGLVGAIFTTCFFVLCVLPWTYLRPMLKSLPPTTKGLVTALIGAAGAMLAFSLAVGSISLIPGVQLWGMQYFGKVLIAEAVAGAVLAVVIGAFKTMQRQIRNAEATLHEQHMREHVLSETAARSQALALQAQINPHFFFNTLNTLSALVPINPDAAQEMIGRLADMFRYTLACSRDEQVTLTQELAFVENYLNLEKARFSDRLRITMPEGQFNDILVPGLSLQPLVENAIKHGIAKRIEGGEVKVSVHRNGTHCSVEVLNPAEPSAARAEFFTDGHALSIVRQRLALRSGSVAVGTSEPGRICVSLLLPLGSPA